MREVTPFTCILLISVYSNYTVLMKTIKLSIDVTKATIGKNV